MIVPYLTSSKKAIIIKVRNFLFIYYNVNIYFICSNICNSFLKVAIYITSFIINSFSGLTNLILRNCRFFLIILSFFFYFLG